MSSSSFMPSVQIYVEWTDTKNQQVEGKVYKTNALVLGMNLSEIPTPILVWEENDFRIEEPAKQEFKYYTFPNTLAMLKVISGDTENEYRGGEQGGTYILLKVPKHINVVDEMGFQMN